MVLYDHCSPGEGWLETREEMGATGELHSAEAPLLSSVSRHGGGSVGSRWKSLTQLNSPQKEMKLGSFLFPARGCFCCSSFPPLLPPVCWMPCSGTC